MAQCFRRYEGQQEGVFLVGCCWDEGARGCESRTGQEKGPECLREAMAVTQMPAQDGLYDCGDLDQHKCDARAQLQETLRTLLRSEKAAVIVVGGTDDINYPATAAIVETLGEVAVVRVDAALDVRPAHQLIEYKDAPVTVNEEHHLSHVRLLLEDERVLSKISRLCVLGLQGHRVTQKET